MNNIDNIEALQQYTGYMQGRVSPSTLKTYVYALNKFFTGANGNALTSKFAQEHIDMLMKAGKSPSTVGIRAHAIMSFFRWKDIVIHLDSPTIRMKKPEYLKPDQIQEAISACRTQLEKTIIVMLYDTAIRISELLNLTMDNIDWEGKTITVIRKGGRETDVNVTEKALKELRIWISMRQGESKKVFMDLDYYTAWLMIKAIGKRAGIDNMHPHIFRHSRAVHMLKAGVKPYVVQQHLGHKSIATTLDIYGAFLAADLKEEIPEW